MKKSLLQRALMSLTLLISFMGGAMSTASAADRFYIDPVYIEPGEPQTLALNLDNEVSYYGFQTNIDLPKGLEFVVENGTPAVSLSSRADSNFSLVTNLLNLGSLRVGAFSSTHSPISGSSGALMFVKVIADDEFAGGELKLSDIHFVGDADRDVVFPDFTMNIRNAADNKCYLPDFSIAVSQTKAVSLILENETSFTAFQTDLYLPEGFSIVANSFKPTDRAADHTISAKSFSDGRTRIVCFSPSNSIIASGDGAVIEFEIRVDRDMEEACKIELKNQTFSTSSAEEYVLPNSTSEVTVLGALVSEIILSESRAEMNIGETLPLTVTVNPSHATNKVIEWVSNNPEVATVSSLGLVTAVGEGVAIVSANSTDGSNVTASCVISVNGIPVSSIILSRGSASLKASEKLQLNATVNPANASDKSLIWKSDNNDVAVVDGTGLVTGVAIGETVITAISVSDPDVSAQCRITVIPTPVSSITLSTTAFQLKATETHRLEAQVAPAEATDKSLTWTSSNSAVATVDANGNITAVAVGEADIKAAANDGSGVSAVCKVTVVPTPVGSVSIIASGSTTLKAGGTVQLSATVLPETATDKTVVWTSSNTAVATVSDTGLVTAVAVGNASITATAGDKTSLVNITVEKTLAESIILNRSSVALIVSGTMQLSALFTPETTTDKSVSWTSSDPTVASVSDSGVVTAHALGECRITAVAKDGSGVSDYCDVTVGETAAESISISPEGPFSVRVGETVQLNATVLPENAADKSVSWISHSGAVSVDENGLVTSIALGTAQVSATNSAGQVASVDFTVVPTPVSSITLSSTAVQLKAAETLKLEARVAPEDATDKSLTWTSSNTAVATVDADGIITAVAFGEAEIKVAANDASGVSAVCKVAVIPTPVENISINASGSTKLKAGGTVQLSASVLPVTATDKSVVWASSNSAVATVDASGLVTAVAVGNASITATAGDKSSSIEIVVEKTLVESIEISANANSIHVGETMLLTATILPSAATDKSIEWSLSESGIVAVKESANTTATIEALTPGIVNVIATSPDGVSGSFPIEVLPNLAVSIALDRSTAKLVVGESTQLVATVLPDNATNKQVRWLSGNTEVATVSDNGLVKAIKPGSCEIIVSTCDGSELSAKCDVTVVQPVTGIALSEHELTLKCKESFALIATIEPIDATDKSVRWESSNPEIAEVDELGVVTANQNNMEGETIVSVTTLDGSDLADECAVTVRKDESGVETITMDDVKIAVDRNRLVISELKSGAFARLYSPDGLLIKSAAGDGSDIVIELEPNRYYILSIGNFSLKLYSK